MKSLIYGPGGEAIEDPRRRSRRLAYLRGERLAALFITLVALCLIGAAVLAGSESGLAVVIFAVGAFGIVRSESEIQLLLALSHLERREESPSS